MRRRAEYISAELPDNRTRQFDNRTNATLRGFRSGTATSPPEQATGSKGDSLKVAKVRADLPLHAVHCISVVPGQILTKFRMAVRWYVQHKMRARLRDDRYVNGRKAGRNVIVPSILHRQSGTATFAREQIVTLVK